MKGVATLCVFLWVTFEFVIHGGEYKANTRRTQGEYASFSPSHYPRDKYFSCAKIMHHILAFYFQQQWYIWAQWARIWYANVCLNSSRICFSYPFSVSSFLSVNFTNPAWYSLSSLLGGFAHSFVGILLSFYHVRRLLRLRCRSQVLRDVGLICFAMSVSGFVFSQPLMCTRTSCWLGILTSRYVDPLCDSSPFLLVS